jgi:uncharacterized protein (DUF58 family)
MLTTRGGAVLGSSAALVAAWVALGEIELLALGAGLAAAVVFALLVTRWNRPLIHVDRRLHPNLVHEGDRATVELQVGNDKRVSALDVTVSDGIDGLGRAGFALGVIGGKETAVASYRIVCRPRGVYRVGPASVAVNDPFGLASLETRVGTVDQLIVYPAVEDLSGFPLVGGRDPATMASRPEHSQRGGEDFYTLRSYREGDDLRRVHWPTSAKLDELMIRQMETPWQSRALVFLDVRASVYPDAESFEKAVGGTASVVRHLARAGFSADLWAGGPIIDVGAYAAAMEALARVGSVPRLDLRAAGARLRRRDQGGLLILVSGRPDHDLFSVYRLLGVQHSTTVLMAVSREPIEILERFRRGGVRTVVVRPSERWAPAWQQTMSRAWIPASVG